jgi:predicted DNA-binding protein
MFSFDLPDDLKAGLQLLKERDGAPVAESIRRAIRLWLEEKHALKAPALARAARRRTK